MAASPEQADRAVRDQASRLRHERASVEPVPIACHDERPCGDRGTAGGQVEAIFGFDGGRQVGEIADAAGQRREERCDCSRDPFVCDHGERGDGEGPVRLAGPYVPGDPALQLSRRNTEPATGGDEHEPVDHVRMIGRQLLRDASARRDPENVHRPAPERTNRVRMLSRERRHRRPRRQAATAVDEQRAAVACQGGERRASGHARQ